MFEYLRSDVLAGLADDDIRFLTRSSVLDRLGGPLCDFVTETEGSPALLDRLERSNVFLLPLDRERKWFRIHAIFRSMLADELERREPGAASELRRRASDWCGNFGDPELALEYARLAGDSERLIELVDGSLLPFGPSGEPAKIARWLEPLDDDELLLAHPRMAAIGALAWALTGRADTADRWADAALRAGEADEAEELSSPWSALLHSLTSPHDAGEMAAEAMQALRDLPLDSAWRGPAFLTLGAAHALAGDPASAEAALRDAAGAAARSGAAPIESAALGLQSLVAAQRGAWRRSDVLAAASRKVVDDAELAGEVTTLFALAANARAALRRGAWPTVRADLDAADRLLPRLTYASGSLSLLLRTELASVHLALGESDRAARLLDEVDEVFARRPGVGVLRKETRELRAQVVASAGRAEGRAATLTSAELRLLPLLTTHLSFREIAERLYVSRNTVKTQAISVYRKLGVSSRGEAVAHASEVGLVAATDERGPV